MPVRTSHAGPNPKYFGPERGVTYYNLVSYQFTGLNAITVPGTADFDAGGNVITLVTAGNDFNFFSASTTGGNDIAVLEEAYQDHVNGWDFYLPRIAELATRQASSP